MSTCLVAQSGGPTAVINASLAGVIRANQLNPLYDRVLGGIHGIEGVLADQLYDLTDLSEHDLELLRQTPSSALGTCRYKLKRDEGWLAASCCITGDVDLLVLPEVAFDRDAFLAEVRAKFEATGSCYIVVSEGARYADGTYLSAGDTAHDGFAHAVLGGAAQTVKQMIVDTGIVPRGVVQDLSRAARSSNFAQSLVDVTEAYDLGMSAHMRSADPAFTGQVVGIRRNPEAAAEGRYEAELFAGPASEFANFVKRFPAEWILPNYQGITPEAVAYFRPLIEGEPKLVMKGGIPATIVPFNKR